jgi:signal transduction histidine kinase
MRHADSKVYQTQSRNERGTRRSWWQAGAAAMLFAIVAARGTASAQAQAQAPSAKAPGEVTLAEVHNRIIKGDATPVSVTCTVLFCPAPGSYYLRDDTGKIRAGYDDNVTLQPGDLVRFTGVPVRFQPVTSLRAQGLSGIPWLTITALQRIGTVELPEPVLLVDKDVYSSEERHSRFDGEFVKVTGLVQRFGNYSSTYAGPGWSERVELDILFIDVHGRTVMVMGHKELNLERHNPVGTLAEFTGTCRLDQMSSPALVQRAAVHVLVPDMDHISVLQSPPFWEVPRHQRRIGLALLGVILCVGTAAVWWRLRRRKTKLRLAAEHRAELERALAREQELSQLKSRFVSIVSHEFRTPLGIIGSSAEILEHYQDKLSPEQRGEHLRVIVENVKRTARMMEDALALSRMDSGAVRFNPAPLHVHGFCERLCDEIISATDRKNPIRMECAAELKTELPLDETLLRHILSNLLNNAVKYSRPDEPVHFRAIRKNGMLQFDIEDQGIGIPEADRERLFEAFHRAENVGDVRGTGLGLVIAKRCCDLHSGAITFESEEGAGTTFHVTLPISPASP